MAKISPTSIKYNITAEFVAEGLLEKPDVIGALFGQTEGLLGSDMELRELQKEGKIGRIEVDLESKDGKIKGTIIIPSALDKTETTIIAAAVETIDKIGPTDANITISEIEDVRGSKREYIMERAKKLLGNIKGQGLEAQEMGEELRESSRISRITEYGDEKLPAGDLSKDEIIVVEGRADVLNLLKHGIDNVIGMNGTKLPAEISKLGEKKKLTLFVDGDRGGKLIAKNVCENADIEHIASAPDGKEVEELTGKEIHQSLRKKVNADEFFKKLARTDRRKSFEKHEEKSKQKSEEKLTKEDREKLRGLISEIKGRNVLVLNNKFEIMKKAPVSKLNYLRLQEPVFVLMVNTAANSVAQAAEKLGAGYIAAKNFGKIDSKKVKLISL